VLHDRRKSFSFAKRGDLRKFIGVDLAWGEGTVARAANETGLVCLDSAGTVLDALTVRGIRPVADWLIGIAEPGDVVAIDAPLVVINESGMRECEREVGQRYGRWRVSANATNLTRAWQGGVTLRIALEAAGFRYTDGSHPPATDTIEVFECYPYTALVGAEEFGYEVERPRYKRPNLALPAAERRQFRAQECDELLRRMAGLAAANPPLQMRSHPVTADLLESPSPLLDVAYKHREDLLDAALSAWIAALWATRGTERCQVLGTGAEPDAAGRRPTIIVPARPEQRRDTALTMAGRRFPI
jgi:predicted RNase H-like nuclease